MNIATVFISEIFRFARMEVCAEVSLVKSASSRYRSDIAELKCRIAQLERLIGQLGKGTRKKVVEASDSEAPTAGRVWCLDLSVGRGQDPAA